MVHPDTPAINGVKSRMQALNKQREQFSGMSKSFSFCLGGLAS